MPSSCSVLGPRTDARRETGGLFRWMRTSAVLDNTLVSRKLKSREHHHCLCRTKKPDAEQQGSPDCAVFVRLLRESRWRKLPAAGSLSAWCEGSGRMWLGINSSVGKVAPVNFRGLKKSVDSRSVEQPSRGQASSDRRKRKERLASRESRGIFCQHLRPASRSRNRKNRVQPKFPGCRSRWCSMGRKRGQCGGAAAGTATLCLFTEKNVKFAHQAGMQIDVDASSERGDEHHHRGVSRIPPE